MVVYRVQRIDDGRGPYRPGETESWSDCDPERQPSLFNEFGSPDEVSRAFASSSWPVFGCGFLSLDGLYRWFSDVESKKLSERGYVVVSMEADGLIFRSNKQVVFGRRLPLTLGVVVLPWGSR